MAEPVYRKSSFSNDNGCFELAGLGDGVVGLRDSKLGDGSPVLRLTRSQLAGLLEGAKAGEFDDLA
jgi:hypothetical protein